MSTDTSDDQTSPDSIEARAAKAVSEFVDAGAADPNASPGDFAPSDPEAADEFWQAVEGLGALIGDVEPEDSGATETAREPGEPAPAMPALPGYKIRRELGRGGMGVVYEAEQQHPRRAVALKVVRGGQFVDKHHVKLFQREVQTLARLKHPYVAAIYDAGRTDDGQHFFAMELVRGKLLKEYVRHKKLPMRERLELFHKICDAINYAHQRGVIHRDLKPSNILIDAEGNPKILDFGLAKITDVDITVTSVVTELGKIQGTLPYMSPEQARGNPDEIDLRSDVYSLGVILYELLAERLPYDVSKAALPEAVRVICEEEPRRPSTISRTLRGDVETIALKALAKEPSRRYQSASALAEDIDRYLTDQPILARPPSAIYQFKKLVARHKAPFAFVAALFVLVTGFGIWMSVLYTHAEQLRADAVAAEQEQSRERERAEQARDDLETVTEFQQSMLGEIDAEKMGRGIITDLRERVEARLTERKVEPEKAAAVLSGFDEAVQGVNATNLALKVVDENVLSRAVEAIQKEFADQPLVRAALQQTVASTYQEIGLDDRAMPLQQAALTTRRDELGDDHPHTLGSINNMGTVLQALGKNEEALPHYREALEGRRRVLGDDHPETLTSISNMGILLQAMDKNDEALPYCRKALEGQRRVLGDDHPDTLTSINNLGLLLQAMGRNEEALPHYREALEGCRRVLGDDHPETLISIHNMGILLQAMGKNDEALAYCREALEGQRRVLGDDHPHTLIFIQNMGFLLQAIATQEEALPYYREALEGSRRVLGEDHPDTLRLIANVGIMLRTMGNNDEALPYCREALEGSRRVLGDDHPRTLKSIYSMGFQLQAMGKNEEALPYYREALEGRRRGLGNDHPSTLNSIHGMGFVLQATGKYEEALPYYREALEGRRRVLDDDHQDTLNSIHSMGRLMRDLGRLDEAEAMGAEAVQRAREALPKGHWYTGAFLSAHSGTLLQLQRLADAEAAMLESHSILETALGADHKRTIKVIQSLIDLYGAWHTAEPGKGYAAKAAEWRAKLPEENGE